VQGKASGGYGALVLAILRPDVCGGLGNVSGDTGFEHAYLQSFAPTWTCYASTASSSSSGAGCSCSCGTRRRTWPRSTRSRWRPAIRPGPDGERELPIDFADGSLREDVWARWPAWDPVRMLDTTSML
jgi:hypothetical protein